MSNQKLLFANIKIPIQVMPDGSIHPFQDNIDIEFTECESLPEPKNNGDTSYLMKKLMNFTGQNKRTVDEPVPMPEPEIDSDNEEETEEDPEPEAKIMISKEDIKAAHARPVNSSFKKRQFKHSHTAKCHTAKHN